MQPLTAPITVSIPMRTPRGVTNPEQVGRHGRPENPHCYALADIATARAQWTTNSVGYAVCRVCRQLQCLLPGDDGAMAEDATS